MPASRVVTGDWVRGREAEMLAAVQSALIEALKIPDTDRDIVLEIFGPEKWLRSPERSDRFTRLEIHLFSGRSIEAKRALYKALVRNLAAIGVPENDIKTVLIEVPRQDWGLRGGVPGSEIELGFKVDV